MVDETPTRRPRSDPGSQQVISDTQHHRLDSRIRRSNGLLKIEALDGADIEDGVSPLQQLLFESSASPSKTSLASRNVPVDPQLPKRPRPGVQPGDETTDSSSAFGSPLRTPPRPYRRLPGRSPRSGSDANHSRQAPPPARSKEGQQPISSIDLPSAPSSSRPTPTPASRPPAGGTPQPRPAAAPPPSLGRPSSATPSSRAAIDPTPLLRKYTALGHPLPDVVRAIRATNFRDAHVDVVLRSLRRGAGVPEGIPGVWTDDDDAWVRSLGGWLDRFRERRERRERREGRGAGLLPGREDRSVFGGDERLWRGFWELVGRHGVEEVFLRRRALRAWDRL
ncbi:hypothetical protein VTK26DRAFT_9177 [Humicola hyalothermophila]